MMDALPFFIPNPSIWMLSKLESLIPLIPIAIEALVEEISLSLMLNSNTDQPLAYPDNFFVIILPPELRADIAFIVGVIVVLKVFSQKTTQGIL
jgi:hypothetical protein